MNESTDHKNIQVYRRKNRIALVILCLFLCACAWTIYAVNHAASEEGVPRPLRAALKFTDKVCGYFFSTNRLTPVYTTAEATKRPRVNGDIGFTDRVSDLNWKIYIGNEYGKFDTTHFITLDAIKLLPKQDVIFGFKCVEGWSQITWWSGASVATILKQFKLGKKANGEWYKYMALETPDSRYYVGIDIASALQEQTIFAYQVSGTNLPKSQGAPVRLIIPVKYGIKHLKRIGKIYFTDNPPRDYWAERGYDYFAGL